MKLEDFNLRTIIAIFIMFFGMIALAFAKYIGMDQIVIGIFSAQIGAVTQYLFGSTRNSEAKDKTISDMTKTAVATDGDPIPPSGPKGGGGKP